MKEPRPPRRFSSRDLARPLAEAMKDDLRPVHSARRRSSPRTRGTPPANGRRAGSPSRRPRASWAAKAARCRRRSARPRPDPSAGGTGPRPHSPRATGRGPDAISHSRASPATASAQSAPPNRDGCPPVLDVPGLGPRELAAPDPVLRLGPDRDRSPQGRPRGRAPTPRAGGPWRAKESRCAWVSTSLIAPSAQVKRPVALAQVAEQGRRGKLLARRQLHQRQGVVAPPVGVDVFPQPAEQPAEKSPRAKSSSKRGAQRERPVPQLRGDHVAQAVAREIAEGARRSSARPAGRPRGPPAGVQPEQLPGGFRPGRGQVRAPRGSRQTGAFSISKRRMMCRLYVTSSASTRIGVGRDRVDREVELLGCRPPAVWAGKRARRRGSETARSRGCARPGFPTAGSAIRAPPCRRSCRARCPGCAAGRPCS